MNCKKKHFCRGPAPLYYSFFLLQWAFNNHMDKNRGGWGQQKVNRGLCDKVQIVYEISICVHSRRMGRSKLANIWSTTQSEDWVPKIKVPKVNTQSQTKYQVWVWLGLCLNSMGIFGMGTHKVQNLRLYVVVECLIIEIHYFFENFCKNNFHSTSKLRAWWLSSVRIKYKPRYNPCELL